MIAASDDWTIAASIRIGASSSFPGSRFERGPRAFLSLRNTLAWGSFTIVGLARLAPRLRNPLPVFGKLSGGRFVPMFLGAGPARSVGIVFGFGFLALADEVGATPALATLPG